MKINLSPQLRNARLLASRIGDALTLNGVEFDLSPMPDGSTLPAEAIASEWIRGPVSRIDGELRLTLRLPHGLNAPRAVEFPEPLSVSVDGPIALPGEETPEVYNGPTSVGEIDWTLLRSAEQKAEESARTLLLSRITANNTAYNKATMALTADYPQLEKDTWPTQNEQSSAWVADPANAATPWIDRAAAERGIEREEYLRRTLVKAEQFKILSAFLTGRRQRYEDQIKAGGDPALDYALTSEVVQQLKQVSDTIMATPAGDMKAALT